MSTKKQRSEAARAMGSARSERKAAAVRENGRMGGRPATVALEFDRLDPLGHALLEYARRTEGGGVWERTHARFRHDRNGEWIIEVTDESDLGSIGWRMFGGVADILAQIVSAK